MRSKRRQTVPSAVCIASTRRQQLTHRAYQRVRDDPSYPGLDFKQVSAKGLTYAAQVGIHYRAHAVRQDDAWLWIWIGSHAEYDRLLRQIH